VGDTPKGVILTGPPVVRFAEVLLRFHMRLGKRAQVSYRQGPRRQRRGLEGLGK
jgi:hypothetical protein